MLKTKWSVWQNQMVWGNTTKPEELNGVLAFTTKEGNKVKLSGYWGYIEQEEDDGN